MAISGKRFQITDGASSPTNLFPYTVTEAVYGLSTVLANTQSAAVSAAATSAASLYLPLSAGSSSPLTGQLTINYGGNYPLVLNNKASGAAYSGVIFQTGGTTISTLLAGTNGQLIRGGAYTIYDSGNSNLNTVKWSCATLNVNRQESTGSVPSGIGLEIQGYSTYVAFKTYTSSAAISTSHLVLDNSGNVGIGTASPGYKLDVAGDINCAGSVLAGSAGGSFGGAFIEFKTASSSTFGGYIDFHYAGSTADYTSRIIEDASGRLSLNSTLYTTGGNVGIGTNAPGVMLDVNGPSRSKYHFFYSTYSSASVGYIGCASGSTDNVFLNLNSGVNLIISNTGGNVGIGNVSSPSQKLHVVGNILSTGDQVISSDAALKKNWREVGYGIEEIANCTVGRFDWKDGHGTSVGSKAQDWLPLVPELVHGEEGNMTLAYGQIALVNSILLAKHETEQDKEIARLKARVKELETRLNIS